MSLTVSFTSRRKNANQLIQDRKKRIAVAAERLGKGAVADARSKAPVKTGFLRSSINSEKAEITGNKVSVRLTVGASYWKHLEYGTRFITARPFIRPALNRIRQLFKSAMQSELKR